VTELNNVMLALTLLLAVMSAVNVLFVTATVASDARRSLAIARAAGATPATAGAAVAFSQLVPASVGTTLGGAAGLLLVHAFGGHLVAPRPYVTVVAAVAAVLAVLALAAWPGYTEARRPVAGTLRTGP
jgi:ABC-type lipoprotein release transport system permease subunit